MTEEDIIRMAQEAGFEIRVLNSIDGNEVLCFDLVITDMLKDFADFATAAEREQIAQMLDGAPPLVEFAQNEHGGCLMCGFTPKLAVAAIRARGQHGD